MKACASAWLWSLGRIVLCSISVKSEENTEKENTTGENENRFRRMFVRARYNARLWRDSTKHVVCGVPSVWKKNNARVIIIIINFSAAWMASEKMHLPEQFRRQSSLLSLLILILYVLTSADTRGFRQEVVTAPPVSSILTQADSVERCSRVIRNNKYAWWREKLLAKYARIIICIENLQSIIYIFSFVLSEYSSLWMNLQSVNKAISHIN